MDRIEKIDDPAHGLGFLFRFITEEGKIVGHYVPTISTLQKLAELSECHMDEILDHSEGLFDDLAKVSAQHYFSDYYFSVGQPDDALAAAKADYRINHPLAM